MGDTPRDPAAIALDEAQAANHRAQERWYAAQADHQILLAEKEKEIIRYQAASADMQELTRDGAKFKREVELATHFHHLFYPFYSDVSDQSVDMCMSQLTLWQRTRPGEPIEIQFNSPGGDVVDGLALFDFIHTLREKGHEITTSTVGFAASMAAVLLQAGDKRIMGRSATMLIHQVSAGAGGRYTDIEDRMVWLGKMQDRLVEILAERSTLSTTEVKERWERRDWWLTADEALELGFVDTIR